MAAEILKPDEIARIEQAHPAGLRAQAIVEIFRPRGVRLSEATFRKYVQAGLLPRSRRVGRKGKHRGSQGLYPVDSVRRINAIKKMMAQGMTLEEIKRSFVFFKNHIDQLERSLSEVMGGFEAAVGDRGPGDAEKKQQLGAQLADVRGRAAALLQDLNRLASAVSAKKAEGEEATNSASP